MPNFTCEHCNCVFYRKRNRHTRFCSSSCSTIETREKRVQTMISKHRYDLCMTPEFMYLMGLLWSDGYIGKRPKITIELITSDFKHVNFPESFSIYNRQRPNRKPISMAYIGNYILYDFLITNGYDLKQYPSEMIINHKNSRYWLLGVIDGDGCWSYTRNVKRGRFCIASNYEQNWDFIQKWFQNIGCRTKIYRTKKKNGNKYSTIYIHRQQDIYNLGSFLYQNYNNDKIGFPRKYDKWKEIVTNNSVKLI